MKKKQVQNNFIKKQEQLHKLSYQAGIMLLSNIIGKLKIDKPIDKEDKKILLDILKLQIVSDRKMESLFAHTLIKEQRYDS